MRASDVVGRKIVSITQERSRDTADSVVYDLTCIELDNGSNVIIQAFETDAEPGVEATVYKKRRIIK